MPSQARMKGFAKGITTPPKSEARPATDKARNSRGVLMENRKNRQMQEAAARTEQFRSDPEVGRLASKEMYGS